MEPLRDASGNIVKDAEVNDVLVALQSPVCYTLGTPFKASAELTVTPADANETVKVQGVGMNGVVFDVETVTAANGKIGYPMKQAGFGLLGGKIQATGMVINWMFSRDNGDNWISAGSSFNQLYVTLGTPTASKLFHTVIDIGCRKGAEVNPQGLSNQQYEDAVVDKIWEEFSDLSVSRVVQPTVLTYYGAGGATSQFHVEELLEMVTASVDHGKNSSLTLLSPKRSTPLLLQLMFSNAACFGVHLVLTSIPH